MRRTRKNWIFCVVAGAVTIILGFIPSWEGIAGANAAPRVAVRVLSVNNDSLAPLGITYSGVQIAEVEVLDGDRKGEVTQATNHLNSSIDTDKLYEPGDKALARVHGEGEILVLIDHYRLDTEGLLFTLFGVLLIIFGGISGLGALISLVLSVMLVWKALIPLLLMGHAPIPMAFLLVTVLTILIMTLVSGWNRITLAAILGSMLGTALTCGLSVLFGNLLKVDGSSMPYVVPLLAQNSMRIDLRELFCAMVFIANSGALMDLAMDVASSCAEVRAHKPDISSRALLLSGFSVGRNVIGTMTTTLMLAYSGSYLSLLMYFVGQGTPIVDVLNLKYVASEILITLVGSFGLVTVAPFTALAASWLFTRERKTAVA